MADATLRVFRGDREGGKAVDYKVPVTEGMVVLDAHGFIALRSARHGVSDEGVSGDQGSGHRRFVELQSEQENSAVPAAAGRRMEDVPTRRGPRAEVPQVHRVLSVPGRLPRLARPR